MPRKEHLKRVSLKTKSRFKNSQYSEATLILYRTSLFSKAKNNTFRQNKPEITWFSTWQKVAVSCKLD